MANHDNTSITTPRVEVSMTLTRADGSQYTVYCGTPDALVSVGLVTQAELDSIGKSGRKTLPPTPTVKRRRITRGVKVYQFDCNYDDPKDAPYKTEQLLPPIKVQTSLGSDMCAGKIVTVYTGTRRQLIHAGLATESMFPQKASHRRSSKQSHSESGNWHMRREWDAEDRWSLVYYTPLREIGDSPYAAYGERWLRSIERFLRRRRNKDCDDDDDDDDDDDY